MKKMAISILLLFCVCTLSVNAGAAYLIPVGQVIGLELSDDTVTITGFDESLGVAAQAAGLRVGDKILAMDEKQIRSVADVRQALERSDGDVKLSILRQEKQQTLVLVPEITADGPKLGLFLKQGVTGIGTVTWYDPETGKFGALGHGVSGSDGKLLHMVSGKAYDAQVASVRKGQVGQPGQLRGSADGRNVLGELQGNTEQGVFGTSEIGWQGTPLETARAKEIQTGKATILSTVSGDTVREYSVEILKIYPRANQAGRNLMLRVTDPELLETTGGIVQGMSGSPIIQNGKLIGAVTHVCVN